MPPLSSKGYWVKVTKGLFLISSLYIIGVSFWWTSESDAFKAREDVRDKRYKAGVERVESELAASTKRGTRTRNSEIYFKKAQQELGSLVATIQSESAQDMNGEKAIQLSIFAGGLLMCVCILGAALNRWFPVHRRASPIAR